MSLCAAGVAVSVGCGDFDLSLRRSGNEPPDDPFGARGEPDADEPKGHAARLDECEDVAHWDRLFARADQERTAVERERVACLAGVNDDAARQIRSDHHEPARVDVGVSEHRGFGVTICSVLVSVFAEEPDLQVIRCTGDIEVALGRILAAHSAIEDEPLTLAEQPWLYPDCNRDASVARDYVDCIEHAVSQRLGRIAHELDLVGATEGLEFLRDPRSVADITCAAFDSPHGPICPADWLMLGREVVDRHVDGS